MTKTSKICLILWILTLIACLAMLILTLVGPAIAPVFSVGGCLPVGVR